MGKIRVKTLGDEEAEKKQQDAARHDKEAKLAKKRAEAKTKSDDAAKTDEAKTEATDEKKVASPSEKSEEKKAKKKDKFKKNTVTHSKKYLSVVANVDKKKIYSLKDALTLLPKINIAKFDETVELHINTHETGVSGKMNLPHGTGKKIRITIANPTKDAKATDDLVKSIESGKIDFDVLIATPDAMPKLARVAKVLGPKGLMPNPKNGTVTKDPESLAKQYENGQVNFRTELKSPIIHLSVGKMSFGEEKLAANIKTAISAIQTSKIRDVTLKSTMSPGIKLNVSSL